jgi:hypothetical protein
MVYGHSDASDNILNLLFCDTETEFKLMKCPDILTLEQAEAKPPSSVLPVDGLRRGEDGTLTEDAQTMIIDGLKSRGIDITDPATKEKNVNELQSLLCTTTKQYDFLLKELNNQLQSAKKLPEKLINTVREKNTFMLDILTISRRIAKIKSYNGSEPFIEGWQSGSSSNSSSGSTNALSKKLLQDREMLESKSYESLRKHMVDITMEKNKVAANYLGIYGFLNMIAIGLIIYVAGIK